MRNLRMTLKSYKLFILGMVASTIVGVAGVFTLLGGEIKSNNMKAEIYEPIYETMAYQEYYKRNMGDYTQDFVDKKITKNEFYDLERKLDAEGFIKQLPENERADYEEKLKPAKDLEKKTLAAGLTLDGIGLGVLFVYLGILGSRREIEIVEEESSEKTDKDELSESED